VRGREDEFDHNQIFIDLGGDSEAICPNALRCCLTRH